MFILVLLFCTISCIFGMHNTCLNVYPMNPICEPELERRFWPMWPSKPVKPVQRDRIVGGIETNIRLHPWQVSLRKRGKHICGGAIINKHTVLTAGHCTCGAIVSQLAVNVGQTNQYINGHIIPVNCFTMHPEYNRSTSPPPYTNSLFDIAVLKLKTSLQWTMEVAPIPLAAAGTPVHSGELVTVTGWGAVNEGGLGSETLRVITVPVINEQHCGFLHSGHVKDYMFCAGYDKGEIDSCQGDSGGPVVAKGKLVGLVSWGVGCAQVEYPGVYTQISYFNKWINEQ